LNTKKRVGPSIVDGTRTANVRDPMPTSDSASAMSRCGISPGALLAVSLDPSDHQPDVGLLLVLALLLLVCLSLVVLALTLRTKSRKRK
jgi:hypothetical protein